MHDIFAPEEFVLQVLSSLDCRLFLPEEKVYARYEKGEKIVLLAQGSCNLYGYVTIRGFEHKVAIARLPERSWYGDFQVLLEVKSSF